MSIDLRSSVERRYAPIGPKSQVGAEPQERPRTDPESAEVSPEQSLGPTIVSRHIPLWDGSSREEAMALSLSEKYGLRWTLRGARFAMSLGRSLRSMALSCFSALRGRTGRGSLRPFSCLC